jgi:tRNA pseudouridine38/39 synthase
VRMDQKPDYSAWTHGSLIKRVTQLELELKQLSQRSIHSIIPRTFAYMENSLSPNAPVETNPRADRAFDPTKYSTRLVAFKLAYLGKKYNGFEYHTGNWTPLPTIEEELFKAFNKARLIFPANGNPLDPGSVNWEGTDYSKCGRTDKGVSAFGQVIGIRVRSSRPLRKRKQSQDVDQEMVDIENMTGEHYNEDEAVNTLPRPDGIELADPPLRPSRRDVDSMDAQELNIDDPEYEDALDFDPIEDEIPYCQVLNRLLPPDIRILAWCPSPPIDFSARFACRERQYKYFFTQPAFSPVPDHLESHVKGGMEPLMKPGWLNIEAMQEAAKAFEGKNDFRNFCKVDGSKQISNFERTIFHSSIEEVDDHTGALSYLDGEGFRAEGSTDSKNPKLYAFNLHGSAFLWHQVRHMVAMLFLVGQGFEKPSIVADLLDVEKNPTRPTYEMATDTPLVLWDCIFPREGDEERKDVINWLYVGDGLRNGEAKFENGGLMEGLWKSWREKKIDEVLAGQLMGIVANQGSIDHNLGRLAKSKANKSHKVFEGGDMPRFQGKYKPVMKKPRLERVEVINEKYALRKGFENAEEFKGYRRLKLPANSEKHF